MGKPAGGAMVPSILIQRQQVAEAVIQGYLDSALSADLSTAKGNGYIPNTQSDMGIANSPIGGINR